MQTRLVIAIAVLFAVVVAGGMLIAWPSPVQAPTATTTPASQRFVSDNVVVDFPLPGGEVGTPVVVTGKARGTWFFEATFPVQIRDRDNNKIGQGFARAQGEWMTREFVPFVATVSVPDYSGPATLVLLKDNPSGLPENDDAAEFPIIIK